MKKTSTTIAIIMIGSCLSGCASGLTKAQKNELSSYRAKQLEVKEKNAGVATALGILPGGGSFYTGHIGYGIANLLLWPFSALWDPISGFNGAEQANYSATIMSVSKKKREELTKLEYRFKYNELSEKEYILKKAEIESKYSAY